MDSLSVSRKVVVEDEHSYSLLSKSHFGFNNAGRIAVDTCNEPLTVALQLFLTCSNTRVDVVFAEKTIMSVQPRGNVVEKPIVDNAVRWVQ